MMQRLWLAAIVFLWSVNALAFELKIEKVSEGIYALVGDIGPRTENNFALNNTMGFVVTAGGVVLVSPGASAYGAKLIHQSISTVTDQPVRWVVNIGAQDHHWLGNHYFATNGAEIIALSNTVASQKSNVDDHLSRLKQQTGQQGDEVKVIYAAKPIDADRTRLNLGGVDMELIWGGGGHFSGDAMLWLPKQKVVFAGDLVFHDRMLGVQEVTPLVKWKIAYDTLASLNPDIVIPGHGHSGNLAKAQRDTGDYLDFLITRVGKALDDWKEIGETVDELAEAPAFKHLKFYEGWHRRNINRTYLQLESTR